MDQTFTSMLLSRPSTQAIADACGVRRQQVNAWASRGWAPLEHHEALAGALGQPAIVAELRRDVVAHKARIKARRAAKAAS